MRLFIAILIICDSIREKVILSQTHYSVLLNETIDGLDIKDTGIYVDCTLGRGGHSVEILKKLTKGKLYCFDQDQEAIKQCQILLSQRSNETYEIISKNFVNLQSELAARNVTEVDGILYDLGVSSPQLEEDDRGFSYRLDADLDMRMDKRQSLTAEQVVNKYDERQLTNILTAFGEEPCATEISRAIIRARSGKRIRTTFDLVAIIKNALPEKIVKNQRKHPAKRTFQAIRIEVNKELSVLTESLKQAVKLLKKQGRLAVITFHSLEDRIVKVFFKSITTDPNHYINKQISGGKNYEILTKKPIVSTEEELAVNHRSKSAKLRILKRVN